MAGTMAGTVVGTMHARSGTGAGVISVAIFSFSGCGCFQAMRELHAAKYSCGAGPHMETPPQRQRLDKTTRGADGSRRRVSPLIWMLTLGAVAFAVDAWRHPTRRHEVVVSRERQIAAQGELAQSLGRSPTQEELRDALESFIEDELLEREARAMGLDVRDPIIRRRLIQKLEQIEIARVDAETVTRQDVEAWIEQHRDQYLLPERVDLDHVFVAERTETPPQRVDELKAALGGGAAAKGLGDPSTHGDTMRGMSRQELTTRFGDEFASAVFSHAQSEARGDSSSASAARTDAAAKQGGLDLAERDESASDENLASAWFVVPSKIGWHILRVRKWIPATPAPWDRIAARATLDLREARREQALAALRVRLREHAVVEWEALDAPPS